MTLEKKIMDTLKALAVPGLPAEEIQIVIRPESVSLLVPAHPALQLPLLKQQLEPALMPLIAPRTLQIAFTAHQEKPAAPARPESLAAVKAVIAIASGKGGVGKSTTAVNLAVAFQQQGYRVGLLDADIYGPSLPMLLGVTEKPTATEDKKIIPLEKFGIRCLSLGLMIPQDQAVIWRGLMVQGATKQLIQDVVWGALDILLIDMPPGTGDVQLTLAQMTALTGAVVVSTPQDLALIDARRGVQMFEKVNVPVLGLVETMSLFTCPHCNHDTDLFGHGGTADEAQKLGLPFLGAVPLERAVRAASDAGTPICQLDPTSRSALAYQKIADKLAAQAGLKRA